MRRVRWLSAQWPISMRALAIRMKNQTFMPESSDGFVIERTRDDLVEAHFIEKYVYQETVTDPFGSESTSERVEYRQMDFTLYADFPNIELRNPHRNTRGFLNKLLELCDFSLTIEPVSKDLLVWVNEFEKIVKIKILVDSMQVSGVEIEPGIYAKMILRSVDDVREALVRISASNKLELDKLQMKFSIGGGTSTCIHLSNSATAGVPDDQWDEYLPVLRKSLSGLK